MSVCRTQASIALSSCEAELYAANGLMVECIYLLRLCKFLCGDDSEVNNDLVQQRLFIDSASALALVRRTGTGRLKHIQIKQFFLQHLLRKGVFTIHKINTKLNTGDMNTKRLGGERRKFLSKLMGLFVGNEDEENDDSKIRQVRSAKVATQKQCIRLIQMAGAAMGVCLQLKGCFKDDGLSHPDLDPVAGGTDFDDNKLLWWTMAEWTISSMWSTLSGLVTVSRFAAYYGVLFASRAMLVVSVGFLLAGPLVWRHPTFLHAFARRHGPQMMGIRYRFIKATLWCGWWMLKHEVQYLNNRFREPNQRGDMMSDFEAVYGALDKYLTGGQNPVTFPATPSPPERGEQEPQGEGQDFPFESDNSPEEVPEVFPENVDLAEAALEHVRRNGVERDQPASAEDMDGSDFEESEVDRRRRYADASQDEISDPEFWAEVHYGEADTYNHERMLAFSRTNQERLTNALASLQRRREDAVNTQNWELVEQYTKAIAEIESLQAIA